MTKGLSQNYSYAYNSSHELIHISAAQRCEKYFCPICGYSMTPHMGKVRRWHFVHKNAGNCSYESYLHELAKVKIRRAFLSSKHFVLSYKAKAFCSVDCPFIGSPKCEGEKPVEFDLRNFYDTCETEATYKQFRADLLLSSSINTKLPPVLIEIYVTHKCTEDKISDGARIIEIPIRSEEHIDNIVDSCKLSAVRYNSLSYNYSNSNENEITLYNFNKVESLDPTGSFDEYEDCFSRRNTIVFCLNEQGKFYSFNCHCYEVSKKLPPRVHYFVTNIATPFKEIFQGFSKRNVKIRNCFLCKFSKQNTCGERLCVLYKKHNLQRKPSPYYASSCSHYREDFDCPKEFVVSQQFPQIEPLDYFSSHKFYFHICKEIL